MHDMPAQPTFPLYDRLLDGKLTELLLEWQADEVPTEEMAYRLRDRGVVVHSRTVRRWIEKIEAAS